MVPGFGSNLLSRKWDGVLSQAGWQFIAKDGQGRTVFPVSADPKGLYYLRNVVRRTTTTGFGVQRKFPPWHGRSSKAQFLAMGDRDKKCQVHMFLLHLCVGGLKLKQQGMLQLSVA